MGKFCYICPSYKKKTPNIMLPFNWYKCLKSLLSNTSIESRDSIKKFFSVSNLTTINLLSLTPIQSNNTVVIK